MDIWTELEQYRENGFVEAKEALGGLPESLWESYSAFANAEGGVILLGVGEREDHSFRVLEIPDPQWLLEEFWAILRNPEYVSVNLLKTEEHTVTEVAQAVGFFDYNHFGRLFRRRYGCTPNQVRQGKVEISG